MEAEGAKKQVAEKKIKESADEKQAGVEKAKEAKALAVQSAEASRQKQIDTNDKKKAAQKTEVEDAKVAKDQKADAESEKNKTISQAN